jgi:glycosyltransferase involved in cell wall biosynthesis
MHARPIFSIIIPCYNAANTLGQTLSSLQAQTLTDWEALLVDDGSSDATGAIIEQAAASDPRLRVLHNPRKGPSSARNHGVAYAQGRIIAFCDADDIWAPHKLSCMAAEFENPKIDAIFARIGFFRNCPSDARVFSTVPRGALQIATLLGENPVCTMSNLCVRYESFLASGGFDESMIHNEDLEWLIRIVGEGSQIIGYDDILVWYRNSCSGLSADFAAMRQGRAQALVTAQRFGVVPNKSAEAIYFRYLSRRALRLQTGRLLPLRFALEGVLASPIGFFGDTRRGGLTLLGALVTPLLWPQFRRWLFSR